MLALIPPVSVKWSFYVRVNHKNCFQKLIMPITVCDIGEVVKGGFVLKTSPSGLWVKLQFYDKGITKMSKVYCSCVDIDNGCTHPFDD